MFVSLNKKLIYAIVLFFITTAIIFLYTFYEIYDTKIQEELKTNIYRNQQYINLIYENSHLKKELINWQKKEPKLQYSEGLLKNIIEKNIENELSREKKEIERLQTTYNEKYASIYQGLKIIGYGAILIGLALILIWILIQRWILIPLNNLTGVSNEIAQGNYSKRVKQEKIHIFQDEIDFLTKTFNKMLDNLEESLKETQETEKFLQKIIDGIPDGLRVIDKEYNVIIANKEYYKMVGKFNEEHKCYEASHHLKFPCHQQNIQCPIQEICDKKEKKIHIIQEFSNLNKKHVYINAAELKIGQKKYIIEVIRDLSDDIRFSHQQKMSSLGFLATSVAHEMKNHLGAIKIILEKIISQQKEENEQKKLMTLIFNQILECIKVPERLLKLTKTSDTEKEIFNCEDNIKDVTNLMDYEAKRQGINIKIIINNTFELLGNETDFKMIMINLILNAIKASQANQEIVIEITEDKQNNIINIIDQGCGIAADKLPHIFEPFYSDGKDQKSKGTGLGLSIVKSLVEKFKGKIKVTSQLNQGSCFSLIFTKTNKKNKLQK